MDLIWLAIPAAIFVVLVPVLLFNSLVRRRNRVDTAFGTIDVMLKKRFDLLPNLAVTVSGYARHEAGVLEKVTEMRRQGTAGSSDEAVRLEDDITRAIGHVMVAVENYPDLKASDHFMHLQRTLNELEEQISASRRAFNAAVLDLNNGVETFPSNIVAEFFGFRRRNMFEITDADRQVPDLTRTEGS